MELFIVPAGLFLMGFRHGLDSDHVAAIADMVGAETQKRRQLVMGILYALGHGLIVLVMGLIAVLVGVHLPDKVLQAMEMLVGTSLLILGSVILYSVFRQRNDYVYVGRWELIYRSVRSLFGRKGKEKMSVAKLGVIGAFFIGIVHGIGAETPTQVALISSAAGLNDTMASVLQIMLFSLGLLVATTGITLIASWGFMKAKIFRKLYTVLGCLTGGSSVVLGIMIIAGV